MTQDMSGTHRDTNLTGTGSDIADQAKATARQAQAKASDIAGQTREQVGSQLSTQKDRVAEGLGGVAQALRQTGQQLREQDQVGLTGYVERAASQVESFSSYLHENDLGHVVDDVERFARREPAIFLGGAFVLGLLGARFLKSSRPRYDPSYYGASSAYETHNRPNSTGYTDTNGHRSAGGYEREVGGRERYNAGMGNYGAPAGPGTAGRSAPGIYDKNGEEA